MRYAHDQGIADISQHSTQNSQQHCRTTAQTATRQTDEQRAHHGITEYMWPVRMQGKRCNRPPPFSAKQQPGIGASQLYYLHRVQIPIRMRSDGKSVECCQT